MTRGNQKGFRKSLDPTIIFFDRLIIYLFIYFGLLVEGCDHVKSEEFQWQQFTQAYK